MAEEEKVVIAADAALPSAVDQQPAAADNATAAAATYTFTPTPLASIATAHRLSSIPILPHRPVPPPPTSLFFTAVHWSPDASCLLTTAEDNTLRLYDTHTLLATASTHPPPSTPALSIPLPAALYAATWHPAMQSALPHTALVAAAVRDQPVQLLSAWTGEQCGSYAGLSDKEEVVSAMSLCFSATGETLYAGYDGHIRAFDTATPGLPYMTVPTAAKGPNKRRRTEGQYGLIASLSAAADGSLLAAGSYSGQAALYDTRTLQTTLVLRCNPTGITGVILRPPLLFTAGRGSHSDIVVFDVRHSRYEAGRIARSAGTQQRVGFDVSGGVDGGRWLVTGEGGGMGGAGGGRGVGLFDLTVASDAVDGYVDGMWVPCDDGGGVEGGGGSVVNGVALHPFFGCEYPYLATVTGCRQFVRYEDDSDTESDSDSDEHGELENRRAEARRQKSIKVHGQPSTLSLWQVQPHAVASLDMG